MKIEILAIGKTSDSFIREGLEKYLARLQHYNRVEFIVLPDVKGAGSLSEDVLKTREGEKYLEKLTATDLVILLDEKGKAFSSREFAGFIEKSQHSGRSRMIFIIGGAFGFSKELYNRADHKISLSSMTMSHQMVRLFFTEQLYRAYTIIRGESYHHD